MDDDRLRAELRARRERLCAELEGAALVLFAAPVRRRNADTEYEYRQDSDFHYLTGFDEPEAALVLRAEAPRFVVFLRPRDPERETWDGRRLGVDAAPEALGADVAHPIGELAERLPDYLENVRRVHYHFGEEREWDEQVFAAVRAVRSRRKKRVDAPSELVSARELVHRLRRVKSPWEIDRLRAAAEATARAHAAAMAACHAGMMEHELASLLEYEFRRGGARRLAYESIVGGGPNATILHYRENDRALRDGELVLVDAGAELDYYAADVTRTYPVSGRFSPAQLRLYEVVLRAQRAALAACAPGSDLDRIHEAAAAELRAGLLALGFRAPPPSDGGPEPAGATTPASADVLPRYYMHRTSHYLGSDVHDAGRYFAGGAPLPLEPGVVLTVEPGLYVASDDELAPEEYRGIGIRIEDDVLITATGAEVLTALSPTEPSEVEAACAASPLR
jgi:Xaa-Pro aminopeptidase